MEDETRERRCECFYRLLSLYTPEAPGNIEFRQQVEQSYELVSGVILKMLQTFQTQEVLDLMKAVNVAKDTLSNPMAELQYRKVIYNKHEGHKCEELEALNLKRISFELTLISKIPGKLETINENGTQDLTVKTDEESLELESLTGNSLNSPFKDLIPTVSSQNDESNASTSDDELSNRRKRLRKHREYMRSVIDKYNPKEDNNGNTGGLPQSYSSNNNDILPSIQTRQICSSPESSSSNNQRDEVLMFCKHQKRPKGMTFETIWAPSAKTDRITRSWEVTSVVLRHREALRKYIQRLYLTSRTRYNNLMREIPEIEKIL